MRRVAVSKLAAKYDSKIATSPRPFAKAQVQQANMTPFIYIHAVSFFITVRGPDAADFLNRLSTQNFKTMTPDQVKYGAFLTGKGTVKSLFTAWREGEGKAAEFCLFFENAYLDSAWEYLNQMHFSENLVIAKKEAFVAEVRGVSVETLTQKSTAKSADTPVENSTQKCRVAFDWGIPGYYVLSADLLPVRSSQSPVEFSELEFDCARAAYGYPKPRQDITEDSILIEGPFESWVDRYKGCYPGQEVIEKIYTYGRLPKKIFKVTSATFIEAKALPIPILFEGENVGTLTSWYGKDLLAARDPDLSPRDFGLASLKRHFSDKHSTFEIHGQEFTVENS